MFGRDRIRGLIAQSLYEELEPGEEAQLDRALDKSAALREEAEELRHMVEGIPRTPLPLPPDLCEGVRAGLREAPRRRAPLTLRFATGLAAFLVVMSGVGYMIVIRPPVAHAPGIAEIGDAVSPLAGALADARALAEGHDYSQAYATLARALTGHEADADAGEVRQTMAAWAYEELRWYPEARENYDALRMQYSAVFRANPENVLRLNLLDEAQGADGAFAPLHALDAARRSGAFGQYEALLGRYPATYVASLAAEDMARLSAEDASDDAGALWMVSAMELALRRCTNPIAQAQLKVEVGHLVYRDLHDSDKARALYEEVAGSDITVLAELARSSLLRLDVSRQ